MTAPDAPVPWLLHVFALIGFAIVGGFVALWVASRLPERAAAEHRSGGRRGDGHPSEKELDKTSLPKLPPGPGPGSDVGWWTARNERILNEREMRRDHS